MNTFVVARIFGHRKHMYSVKADALDDVLKTIFGEKKRYFDPEDYIEACDRKNGQNGIPYYMIFDGEKDEWVFGQVDP